MPALRTCLMTSLLTPAIAVVAGCASDGPIGPGEIGTGSMAVEIATTGMPGVPFLGVVVEGATHTIGFNDELQLGGLEPGRYSVELRDVPGRCSVEGETARQFDVQADSAITVAFQLNCPCLTDMDNKILFSHTDIRYYRFEGIYSIDAGTRERLFLTGTGGDWDAAASPRGDALAYAEVRSCGMLCYTSTVRIVNSCNARVAALVAAFHPVWSSDGQYLAFSRSSTFNVVRADGSHVAERSGAMGAWSADGTRVAYTATNGDVWTMNFDGTDAVNLTNSAGTRQHLRWSPDGAKIAFTVPAPDSDDLGDIYTVTTDGSAVECLRCDAADEGYPVWSPDGSRLAFRRADAGMMVAGPDGANPVLVATPVMTGAPIWSPDGSRLAFTCLDDTTGNVCVVNADGSGRVFLTQDSGFDVVSAWGSQRD